MHIKKTSAPYRPMTNSDKRSAQTASNSNSDAPEAPTPPPSPAHAPAVPLDTNLHLDKQLYMPPFFQMSPTIEIRIEHRPNALAAASASETPDPEENQEVNAPIPMPILPNGAPVPPAPTAPPSSKKNCFKTVNTNYVVYFLLVCASILAILIPTLITTFGKKT